MTSVARSNFNKIDDRNNPITGNNNRKRNVVMERPNSDGENELAVTTASRNNERNHHNCNDCGLGNQFYNSPHR